MKDALPPHDLTLFNLSLIFLLHLTLSPRDHYVVRRRWWTGFDFYTLVLLFLFHWSFKGLVLEHVYGQWMVLS